MENWRQFLYFSIGVLPSLFFGSRFLLQWIQSERKKQSVVSSLFWKLSISGNVLLSIHYFIQFQYFFLLIQVVNAFIAWRNLNFLRSLKPPISLRSSCILLSCLLATVCALCAFQSSISDIKTSILAPPVGIVNESTTTIHFSWHLLGMVGAILFASRFWIQWIQTERHKRSLFGAHFWIMSLIGSLCCLPYFLHIKDWISASNYAIGTIPYLRNLVLMRKSAKENTVEMSQQ